MANEETTAQKMEATTEEPFKSLEEAEAAAKPNHIIVSNDNGVTFLVIPTERKTVANSLGYDVHE
ncbi:hypothetical protein [Sinobaca sp. H24]|uniref:hypothetical protein n=1 Tax=Sinobaca sp. H24 TaxID=2923376 RepID=UPI00207AA27F|nr:hypothetical protein [Sinobaca sp. H24]